MRVTKMLTEKKLQIPNGIM
ncbi:UNVERIFIED_CONTAM: hypothetical protein GTU68_021142 [Idotea baltica]|nr:hypothetical protein [Idotea baltica]